jgi:hypothetical protein
MFAEGVDPTAGIIGMVLQGGSLVALVYLIVVVVPDRLRKSDEVREKETESRAKVSGDHLEQMKQQSARHREVIEHIADRHATTVANMIATHNDEVRQMLDAFASQAQYEREQCAEQFGQVMGKLSQQAEAAARTQDIVREVRHEVANIAQARANERALAEEKARQRQSPGARGRS